MFRGDKYNSRGKSYNIKKGVDIMSADLSESKTRINLMLAGESQARNRYTFAASKAKKMNCWFLYNIFTLTANQEKEHAEIFYDHLISQNGKKIIIDSADYPVDNYDKIEELLRSAQKNEYDEYENVYPEFARTAKEEGFADIAFSFEKTAEIEKIHGDRFGCFAELIESGKMYEGEEDTEWICLNCGHIQKGKTVPKQCPVCQHPQGYFVPFKYYRFIAERYGMAEL